MAVAAGEARPEEPGRDGVAATGPMPLTPAASALAEIGGDLAGYARAMVAQLPGGLTEDRLAQVVQLLLDHHDALRMKIAADAAGTWRQEIVPPGAVLAAGLLSRVDVVGVNERRLAEVIAAQARAARQRLNPGDAVMAQLVWLDAGDQAGRLLVVLHHLVADDESWRMLLADLASACDAAAKDTSARLEPPFTSLREWARGLEKAATEPSRVGEYRYWRENGNLPEPLLGSRPLDPARDVAGQAGALSFMIGPELAGPLLSSIPVIYRADADDILLTGLVLAVIRWRETHGRPSSVVKVMLEGNGREERTVVGADLSRTVGRFTSPFPASLNPGAVAWTDVLAARPAVGTALRRVKDQLRAVPGTGLGYGLLRYLNAETGPVLASQPQPQLRFRYLSRLGAADAGAADAGAADAGAADAEAADDAGVGRWTADRTLTALAGITEPDLPLAHAVEVEVLAQNLPDGPSLSLSWVWAAGVLSEQDIRELAEHWHRALEALARVSQDPAASMLTPSDVPLVLVTQDEIESMEQELRSGRETSA
jgi:aspartate racemase